MSYEEQKESFNHWLMHGDCLEEMKKIPSGMSDDLKKKTSQAKRLHQLAKEKSEAGDFAYQLAARSFESHFDELAKDKINSAKTAQKNDA